MFKRHLWPAIQWICRGILHLWCYLSRPFRRRSYSMELPLASPVVPSTPSFIQSQEPNFTLDAMRIFQLNNESAQEPHLARNKLAVQQMRNAPPSINRVASLSSTDPSPGFSLLTDVIENLVTPTEPDSPSLYSSPPSSPSSSLHTPCIVVSSPMSDTVSLPRNDAGLSPDCGPQREPQIAGLESVSQGEFPWLRQLPLEVNGLAKRRNFKGSPIITHISRDSLPSPTTRLSQSNVTPTDLHRQQSLSRPKSALAVVTDFVRASTNLPLRSPSRETLVVSPESQAAFTQSSPFSAEAESFFIDDHLSRSPQFDIHNLGIYTEAGSTLDLQVPRRKRTASEPILTKRLGEGCRRASSFSTMTSVPYKRPRALSHLSKPDISSASETRSFVSIAPSISPQMLDVQRISSTGLWTCESEFEVEARDAEERTVPSRASLYASLIFPFSLEDSVSWDTSSDFQYREVGPVTSKAPVPGSVMLDGDIVGGLECDPVQFPDPTAALFISDHRCSNLPSINVADTEDDLKGGNDAMLVPVMECPIFLPKVPFPTIDESFFAGSRNFSSRSLLGMRNNVGLWEDQRDLACGLREIPLRQVGILDGLFISSGDSSVLPPISESTFCVGGSQTFSSLMSVSSIECDGVECVSVPVPVNNRRARRVGIYGSLLPPLTTPGVQNNLVSDSEKCPDRPASERQRGTSRHASRHVSALRPLVLPMRVAIRELGNPSAGDRSLEKSPDMLLQSNRNSIGFPPPYPLPEPPSYKSSSTSTFINSVFPSSENLQKRKNIPPLVPRPTYAAPESYLDPDEDESTHTVNWGVAF